MSRDFDNIIKEVMKSNKDLNRIDDKFSKEISLLDKDIQNLRKEVKGLSSKLDEILEILNTLTIFIEDAESILDEDDGEEEYQSNEGWLPEVNNWEENRDDDEEDI
jgi:prefoldin subunit 5